MELGEKDTEPEDSKRGREKPENQHHEGSRVVYLREEMT